MSREDSLAGFLPRAATCVFMERLRVFFLEGAGREGGFEGLACASVE